MGAGKGPRHADISAKRCGALLGGRHDRVEQTEKARPERKVACFDGKRKRRQPDLAAATCVTYDERCTVGPLEDRLERVGVIGREHDASLRAELRETGRSFPKERRSAGRIRATR